MSALPLKADMRSATSDVGMVLVMSALPLKAGMCGATRDVR
jgi:hypothetical protein